MQRFRPWAAKASSGVLLAGLLQAIPANLVALDLPALPRKAGYPGTRPATPSRPPLSFCAKVGNSN